MTEQVPPPQGGGLIPTPPLHFIPLPKQEATQLVIEHHYLHRKCPISWAWGIARSKTNPLRLVLLKRDWTSGPVIVSSTQVTTPTVDKPLVEYFICEYGDCTTQVPAKADRCCRHKAEPEVSCVN